MNSDPLWSSWRTFTGSAQPEPIARWNPARCVWETGTTSLFCGHLEPYRETLPPSGMQASGILYELPTSVPRTSASESFFLPTPTAQLNAPAPWKEGVDWWLQSRATRNLEGVLTGNTPLLPTPVARDSEGGNFNPSEKKPASEHSLNTVILRQAKNLLPTPVARDYMGIPGDNVQMASLPREISLLPTPMAGEDVHNWRDHHGRNKTLRYTLSEMDDRWEKRRQENLSVTESRWGRYSSAIFLWENTLARKAPEPTEPTGRNGNPRLSPKFVEWMQGLPEGWVTDVPGLTRRGQLHSLGNGVVPQQAEMALRLLLERIPK